MTTDGAAWKLSALSVETSIEPSPALPLPEASATWAELMFTEFVPYALEKRTRACLPPMVTWTNCRKVLLASGTGGRLPRSVSCGAQAQVPTQLDELAGETPALPGDADFELTAAARIREAMSRFRSFMER